MSREAALTPEKILQAAEEVLRRYGPEKANVVDVAKALDVTHGSVYRHFPSKAALRDAVLEKWLKERCLPLDLIAAEQGDAPFRLRRWVEALAATKQNGMRRDPEMFATYFKLAEDAREVVARHVDHLVAQIGGIVAAGVAEGTFATDDPLAAGKAVLAATSRFHHPAHAAEWNSPTLQADFDAVWRLVVGGLKK